jgi:hypothetical protein
MQVIKKYEFFYITSLKSLKIGVGSGVGYGVGSGSGSIVRGAHPRIRISTTMSRTPNTASELTDQDSDPAPAIFVSDHPDGNFKKNFYVFCLLLFMLHLHIFLRKKS